MSGAVLRAADVHLRRGQRTILAGASLEVEPGECVALMGPSGAGKTTILRILAALEPFDRGRIAIGSVELLGGRPPAPAALRQLRRTVALVFQFHCLFEHLSALDNVCLAPVHVYGTPAAEARRRAHELLASLGVDHRAGALPRELSGGEAQRVAIARALAVDPQLLLMDEPTASLDPDRRAELAALLRGMAGGGRSLLVATHDEGFARQVARRVVRLDAGRLAPA